MPAPLMTSRTFSGLVQLVERQPAAAVIVDSLSVAHARQAVLGMSTPPALIAWRGCYTSQVTAAFIASGADEVLHRTGTVPNWPPGSAAAPTVGRPARQRRTEIRVYGSTAWSRPVQAQPSRAGSAGRASRVPATGSEPAAGTSSGKAGS